MTAFSPTPSRVLKFGGAALADGPAVRRACSIVADHGGERPVVIVSALEGVTALLEELAEGRAETRTLRIRHRSLLTQLELSSELLDPFFRELSGLVASLSQATQVDRRSRDHLLSFGERMSARIVAAALRARGNLATPVDAHDLGLVIESREGEPALKSSTAAKIRSAIEEVPGIPVVTGFLAADERGNLTTLGRNGSDLTALFVGEAIGAAEVQLWKSVAGIQTADPRVVAGARTIEEIGFDEVIEIARHGARVMHYGAALAASRAGIAVSLRDVRQPDGPGTRLVAKSNETGPVALVHRDQVLSLKWNESEESVRDAIAGQLEDGGAPLEWVRGEAGAWRLIAADTSSTRSLLESSGAELTRGLASITLVGPSVGVDEALHARVHDQLRSAGIETESAPSEIHNASHSWLIPSEHLPKALILLHTITTDRTPAVA